MLNIKTLWQGPVPHFWIRKWMEVTKHLSFEIAYRTPLGGPAAPVFLNAMVGRCIAPSGEVLGQDIVITSPGGGEGTLHINWSIVCWRWRITTKRKGFVRCFVPCSVYDHCTVGSSLALTSAILNQRHSQQVSFHFEDVIFKVVWSPVSALYDL